MVRKLVYLFIPVIFILTACPTGGHHHHDAQSWKVSFYWDEQDETSNFSEYYFMFNSGGRLMAHKGSETHIGTWSETSTNLSINFGNTPVLSDLNNDWIKLEDGFAILKLRDDNPAQDDEVHFVKN